MISQDSKAAFRNPWVLGIVALVLVVLAVNSVLIWLSTHKQSTLVDRAYKTKDRKSGAEFISELGGQKALGWQVTFKRLPELVLGEPALFEFTVTDRDGQPVSGEAMVEAYRAADASQDFSTRFKEVSIGRYQGLLSFPLKGYWELHVRVERGGEVFSVSTQRFSVAGSR